MEKQNEQGFKIEPRAIKFKVWDKNLKYFIYWDQIEEGLIDPYYLFWKEDDNLVILQFTGLYDSKGVEIYEGDILLNKHPKSRKGSFFVKYNLCGYDAVYENNFTLCLYPVLVHEIGGCEIIGNVFEDFNLK